MTRKIIYKVVENGKLDIFTNRRSVNHRYQSVYWGLKHLSKVETRLAKQIAKREHRLKRYEKSMPGEQIHLDTAQMPLIAGEAIITPREYLFVAVDDYSRWLFADIFPDKTSYSAAIFLEEARRAMPFHVSAVLTDNGSEYKGRKGHPFVDVCRKYGIQQSFTKVRHPWTNGKAERVIKTIKEWTRGRYFRDRDQRRKQLYAFVDWYNQARPHQSLNGQTPLERLETLLAKIKEEAKKQI